MTLAVATVRASSDAVYVWQRQWTPLVTQAVGDLASAAGEFVVLGGSVTCSAGALVTKPVAVWWDAFRGATNVVTLAWRIEPAVAAMLCSPTDAMAVVQTVVRETQAAACGAHAVGVRIDGLQVDYDAASSRLGDYAAFLRLLRRRIPGMQLSITALPTWLDKAAFRQLADEVDYYVLQLHSFELPKTAAAAVEIFPLRRASGYIAAARAVGRPFRISLPTYGYEMRFDKRGRFKGIRAEARAAPNSAGGQAKVVMTDPFMMLGFLRATHAGGGATTPSVLWFRLPLPTDEFNWHVRTLRKVMRRETPATSIVARAMPVSTDLYHVVVENTGDTDIRDPVRFPVMVGNDMAFMHDVAGASTAARLAGTNGIMLTTRAPRPGATAIVAWLRLLPDATPRTGADVRPGSVILTDQQ